MRLGIFEYIDKQSDNWNGFDKSMQWICISADIETFAKNKDYKTKNWREGISIKIINEVNSIILDIETENAEKKANYLALIDKYCKTYIQHSLTSTNNEGKDEKFEKKAIKTELKVASHRKDEDSSTEKKIELSKSLDELIQFNKLSTIENDSLDYIRSGFVQDHPSLCQFTLQGVLQIANRAALKVYYSSLNSNNHIVDRNEIE